MFTDKVPPALKETKMLSLLNLTQVDSQSYNADENESAGPSLVYHEEGMSCFFCSLCTVSYFGCCSCFFTVCVWFLLFYLGRLSEGGTMFVINHKCDPRCLAFPLRLNELTPALVLN